MLNVHEEGAPVVHEAGRVKPETPEAVQPVNVFVVPVVGGVGTSVRVTDQLYCSTSPQAPGGTG